MKPENKIIEMYKNADFDKSDTVQKKIYSNINRTNQHFRPIWFFAPAITLFAAILLWPIIKPEVNIAPVQSEPSKEECVDLSTRYWFEKAAEQSRIITAKCPKNFLSDYNSDVISQFQQKLEETNPKLSQDEKRKLDNCDEKFKVVVHPVISYDAEC